MIRTIAFEASGESDEGKAAVAYVILNRVKSGVWGDSIKDVVTHPWQFEPWMTRRVCTGTTCWLIGDRIGSFMSVSVCRIPT